jgi:hypothetical protein
MLVRRFRTPRRHDHRGRANSDDKTGNVFFIGGPQPGDRSERQSCNRSIAFEVRIDFRWLGGKRVKVKSLSPASSRLSATARRLIRFPK